jgi:hypothetical protein
MIKMWYTCYSCQILFKLESSPQIFETQISNLMKIRPVGRELFHADGQTDKHDEANSHISQFCERALKKPMFCPHSLFVRFVPISEQTAMFSLHSIN